MIVSIGLRLYYCTRSKTKKLFLSVCLSLGYVYDGFHLPVSVFAPHPRVHVPITIAVVIKNCETSRRSLCVVFVIIVGVIVVDFVMTMANHSFVRMLFSPEGHRATVHTQPPKIYMFNKVIIVCHFFFFCPSFVCTFRIGPFFFCLFTYVFLVVGIRGDYYWDVLSRHIEIKLHRLFTCGGCELWG